MPVSFNIHTLREQYLKTLIIKLGATGDVVRTTTLLNVLEGEIHWLTADMNTVMVEPLDQVSECLPWRNRSILSGREYDLVINLEDAQETAVLLKTISFKELYGAYIDNFGHLVYTDSSRDWFDLSLISRFGRKRADQLKLKNRQSYQELVFRGLGYHFSGHPYVLPAATETDLKGDIAIAPKSGEVWPMKNWAYFDQFKQLLEERGYRVNYLPMRETLLEHLGDIQNHHFLISGDSLPMHLGLGSRLRCLAMFFCTSPWEIYDYGLLNKLISPRLTEFFYMRGFFREAVTALSLENVKNAFDALATSQQASGFH